MPDETKIPISQKLRDIADWFEEYQLWREQYHATVESGGNPGTGNPPPPPPKGFITEEEE